MRWGSGLTQKERVAIAAAKMDEAKMMLLMAPLWQASSAQEVETGVVMTEAGPQQPTMYGNFLDMT